MGTEANKKLVHRQFDEIWNGANWATVDELYAPNCVNHDPYNPDQPAGPEGFKQRVAGYRSVLHGFDPGSNSNWPRATWSKPTGRCAAPTADRWKAPPPTGKAIYVDGQLLSRIVDGKFVEEWVHWDTLGLLRQIGAVPPPSA
jgi:hypothetical protein